MTMGGQPNLLHVASEIKIPGPKELIFLDQVD